jgi:hypothetical protein
MDSGLKHILEAVCSAYSDRNKKKISKEFGLAVRSSILLQEGHVTGNMNLSRLSIFPPGFPLISLAI